MAERILVGELSFRPFLTEEQLRQRVAEMGRELEGDYHGRNPYFLVMLKGAFIFAADLIRASRLTGEIGFVRVSSYLGLSSTRQLTTHLLPEAAEVRGRDVIIIEDIVDSGHTLHHFLPLVQALEPASLSIATLLFKPDAVEVPVQLDYVGFSIPPKFVIGYGLDYDGRGRQLRGIYQLEEEEPGG